MASFKRALIVVCSLSLLVFGCMALAGCGQEETKTDKQIAATWAHGDVAEEDVTTTIENLRSSYGLTDDSTWAMFIASKAYDPEIATGTELVKDGTIEDMRKYVIDQQIRSAVVDYEAKQQNIQVTDDDLNEYVEQQRQAVESSLMAGVFESYLQKQGYKNLADYKEQSRSTVAMQKLVKQNAETDDEAGWNAYIDGLIANADVHINDMPSDLSYIVDMSNVEADLDKAVEELAASASEGTN